MPALPLDEAGKYVAGAYVVFLALIVVYVAIIAAKVARIVFSTACTSPMMRRLARMRWAMSLYGVMRTSVSGMNAQSNKLAAVADNIANANTTGYKRASTEFSTLVDEASNEGESTSEPAEGAVEATSEEGAEKAS